MQDFGTKAITASRMCNTANEYTLTLERVAEIAGDHYCTINFSNTRPLIAWQVRIDGIWTPLNGSSGFFFTAAGESYTLKATTSGGGFEGDAFELPYTVVAVYAPDWASGEGIIVVTLVDAGRPCLSINGVKLVPCPTDTQVCASMRQFYTVPTSNHLDCILSPAIEYTEESSTQVCVDGEIGIAALTRFDTPYKLYAVKSCGGGLAVTVADAPFFFYESETNVLSAIATNGVGGGIDRRECELLIQAYSPPSAWVVLVPSLVPLVNGTATCVACGNLTLTDLHSTCVATTRIMYLLDDNYSSVSLWIHTSDGFDGSVTITKWNPPSVIVSMDSADTYCNPVIRNAPFWMYIRSSTTQNITGIVLRTIGPNGVTIDSWGVPVSSAPAATTQLNYSVEQHRIVQHQASNINSLTPVYLQGTVYLNVLDAIEMYSGPSAVHNCSGAWCPAPYSAQVTYGQSLVTTTIAAQSRNAAIHHIDTPITIEVDYTYSVFGMSATIAGTWTISGIACVQQVFNKTEFYAGFNGSRSATLSCMSCGTDIEESDDLSQFVLTSVPSPCGGVFEVICSGYAQRYIRSGNVLGQIINLSVQLRWK